MSHILIMMGKGLAVIMALLFFILGILKMHKWLSTDK
jgi:hypothetical protein